MEDPWLSGHRDPARKTRVGPLLKVAGPPPSPRAGRISIVGVVGGRRFVPG